MTEAEAKQKVCPMALMRTFTDYAGANTDWNGCIASDCMMWRWTNELGRVLSTGQEVPVAGYCGFGGKP